MLKFKLMFAVDDGANGGGDPVPPVEQQEQQEQQVFDAAAKLDNVKYRSQLPKRLQESDLNDVPTLESLVDSYTANKAKLNNALFPPTAESTPEEIKGFFTKIGMPESKDGYELSDYDLDPNELTDLKSLFRDSCFASGLTKAQADRQWKTYVATYKGLKDSINNQVETNKEQFSAKYDVLLKTEYTDDAKRAERIVFEKNLYNSFINKANLGNILTESGFDFNPAFVHAIAKYQEKIEPNSIFSQNGAEKTGIKGFYNKSFYDQFDK